MIARTPAEGLERTPMMLPSRTLGRLLLLACFIAVGWLFYFHDARAQDIDEEESHRLYEKGRIAFKKKQFEEASRLYDESLRKTRRPSWGLLIAKAQADVGTGKPKSGAEVLRAALPIAKRERERLQAQRDVARAQKQQIRVGELQPDFDEADKRVVEIETSLTIAAALMCRVYVTVPNTERAAGLTIKLDGALIDEAKWVGSAIEVDAGRHTVVATTPSTATQERVDIRFVETGEANAQKPLKIDVTLGPVPVRYPVVGIIKLNDEMSRRLGVLKDRIDESGRTHNPQRSCFSTAWGQINELHNKAQWLLESGGGESKGAEDDFEVTKIRSIIQYEIEPCLDDCLSGRRQCDASKDLPGRIWPCRGSCCACEIGSRGTSDMDDRDRFGVVTSLFVLSLAVTRARRRRGR